MHVLPSIAHPPTWLQAAVADLENAPAPGFTLGEFHSHRLFQQPASSAMDASHKPSPRVVLEGIRPPGVAANCLDLLVPAYIHHPENVGARLGSTGQEARPEGQPP